MKLSDQLEQNHLSGDFGNAFEGYGKRAKIFEDALEEAAIKLERCRYSEQPLAKKLRGILADNA